MIEIQIVNVLVTYCKIHECSEITISTLYKLKTFVEECFKDSPVHIRLDKVSLSELEAEYPYYFQWDIFNSLILYKGISSLGSRSANDLNWALPDSIRPKFLEIVRRFEVTND